MKLDFKAPIAAFAKLLNLTQETVVRVIANELWIGITAGARVSPGTPVDTGRARASWAMSEGTPSTLVPPEGSYPDLPTFINPTGKTNVFIVSNLDYIHALEHGHSDQAPQGMVRLTIAEVSAKIELIVKKALANGHPT